MTKPKESGHDKGLTVDDRFVTDAHRAQIEGSDITEERILKLQQAVTATARCTPEVSSAAIIQDLHCTSDINALVDELRHQTALVQEGNLERPKAMLLAQAQALDALFLTLCKRSLANARDGRYMDAAERYMRLALKAQSQAVRTLEVLSDVVHPRAMAFVGQANIANGPQQVNNHPAGADENSAKQTISETCDELRQNAGTSGIKSATHSAVGAVEQVERTQDERRKKSRESERLQGWSTDSVTRNSRSIEESKIRCG